MNDVIAIIVAAGKGTRFSDGSNGNYLPKQYAMLRGKPVLAHSISLFEGMSAVGGIIVIVPQEFKDFTWENVIKPNGYKKVIAVIDGGADRQDSVAKGLKSLGLKSLGLKALGDLAPSIILVHDGVRPLADAALCERVIEAAKIYGSTAPGVAVKDTIKRCENGFVKNTMDRSELFAMQTPQGFQSELLYEAYVNAEKQGIRATDDTMLVEAIGRPTFITKGDYKNIKITTAEDLSIAEYLMSLQNPVPGLNEACNARMPV